jgi:hypothetical protein
LELASGVSRELSSRQAGNNCGGQGREVSGHKKKSWKDNCAEKLKSEKNYGEPPFIGKKPTLL